MDKIVKLREIGWDDKPSITFQFNETLSLRDSIKGEGYNNFKIQIPTEFRIFDKNNPVVHHYCIFYVSTGDGFCRIRLSEWNLIELYEWLGKVLSNEKFQALMNKASTASTRLTKERLEKIIKEEEKKMEEKGI